MRGDVYKAIRLGELWEDITRGQGYSHSCNHDKEQHGDECGIGRIKRSDRGIRRHVHKVVKYLVKDAQHLRLRPEELDASGRECSDSRTSWARMVCLNTASIV